jgi:SOS-response transcriptional repressor LexA
MPKDNKKISSIMHKSEESLNFNTKDIIKYLMKRNNINSETQLALKIGIPQATLNRLLLADSRDPRASTLIPIAQFFNVSIDELLGIKPLKLDLDGSINDGKYNYNVHSLPIIDWEMVPEWQSNLINISPANYNEWVTIDKNLSKSAFALRSFSMLEPRFKKNSILVVDPEFPYKDGHYVVVGIDNKIPTVRKYLCDGANIYLANVNNLVQYDKLEDNYRIYGPIIESRLDLYD